MSMIHMRHMVALDFLSATVLMNITPLIVGLWEVISALGIDPVRITGHPETIRSRSLVRGNVAMPNGLCTSISSNPVSG
jgi:hypothetical protein